MIIVFFFIVYNGFVFLVIGLGMYCFDGDVGVDVVVVGIGVGYWFVDMVFNYENEGFVGCGVVVLGILCGEIIVMIKLLGWYYVMVKVCISIEESWLCFGVDVIDLYFIYWFNLSQDEYVQVWVVFVDV